MPRTKGSKNKPKAAVKTAKKVTKPVSSSTLATLYLMSKDKRETMHEVKKLYIYLAMVSLACAFTFWMIVTH